MKNEKDNFFYQSFNEGKKFEEKHSKIMYLSTYIKIQVRGNFCRIFFKVSSIYIYIV